MKEVIWDDERVGLLEEQIKKFDEKGVFSNNAETLFVNFM